MVLFRDEFIEKYLPEEVKEKIEYGYIRKIHINPLVSDIGYHRDSGWHLTGNIGSEEFVCVWIENFKADHMKYGTIQGSFTGQIEYSSEEALLDFLRHFELNVWDLEDYLIKR